MTMPLPGPAEDPTPDASAGDEPRGGTTVDGDRSRVTLDRLLDGIRRLQSSFDSKIRYDEVRERSVQSMSDELAGYREHQGQAQLRPLLIDLIALNDDLTKVGESADGAADTAQVLDRFRDTVEDILARNGVEPFTVEGEALDRARQRVISVLPSGDPSADRRIAHRLRPGFTWHDRVLRPEWVSVYRYATSSPLAGPTIPPAVPEPDEGALR